MPNRTSLENHHKSLENKIDNELSRPAPDTIKVSALKKEKLRIKEQLISFQT